MLDGDPKLLALSAVYCQALPVSCYGESDTLPSCVVFHLGLSPNQRGRTNLEKETPLTLPISLIADGKWRSSAPGWRFESPYTKHGSKKFLRPSKRLGKFFVEEAV